MSDGQAAQSTGGELASRIEAEEEDWADFEFRFGIWWRLLFPPSPGGRWPRRPLDRPENDVSSGAVCRGPCSCRKPGAASRSGEVHGFWRGRGFASRSSIHFSRIFLFLFICLPHVLYGIALVPEATLNVVG